MNMPKRVSKINYSKTMKYITEVVSIVAEETILNAANEIKFKAAQTL